MGNLTFREWKSGRLTKKFVLKGYCLERFNCNRVIQRSASPLYSKTGKCCEKSKGIAKKYRKNTLFAKKIES